MNRKQKYRYEMFVRVRDFGTANRGLFAESTVGSAEFEKVTAAVAAIEAHLTGRDLARAEAQRVKVATRRAVTDYMKRIASTGRQVIGAESGMNPFRMPTRKSAAVILSRARLFVAQASRRQPQFVRLGLPETFIREFQTLVDDLDRAVNVRLNSHTARGEAQQGIETALATGFKAIRALDVIVANTLRLDPVRLAAWQAARHLEGLGSTSLAPVTEPVTPAATTEALVERPADAPAAVAPATMPGDAMGRAS